MTAGVRAELLRSANTVRELGFTFLPRWQPKTTTLELAEYVGPVFDIGKFLPHSRIPIVQSLEPRREADAGNNKYSKSFGVKEFPLHTDLAHWALPPRYMILRCRIGGAH